MSPSETPALAPPDGRTSNFEHPDGSRRRASYIMASICLILATLAVILRVFTKARVLRAMNTEEYILIASLVGLFAFVAVLLLATHFGSGVHQWDVTMTDFGYFMDMINGAELIYFPTILCARIAMMVQVKRMFIPINQGVLFWIYVVLLVANICCNTSLFFALLFACDPLEKLWDPSVPGHCINTVYVCLSSSALNGVSDLTMLILPLGVVIKMNLSVKVKAYLCAIFGTGIVAVMSSAFRLSYYVIFSKSSDVTWGWEPTGHWAMAEIASVILAGSVPLLPGFMRYAHTPQHSLPSPTSSRVKSWLERGRKGIRVTQDLLSTTASSRADTTVDGHRSGGDGHNASFIWDGTKDENEAVILKTTRIECSTHDDAERGSVDRT